MNILKADPRKIDAGIAFVRERVQPLVTTLPGSRGLGMWVNRHTGDVVVNTVWDDHAAQQASESHVRDVRAEAASVLGAETVRVELVEPSVVWQAAADQPGYWSRSVDMDVPTDRVEEAIALFRDEVLAKVQQIEGVNTVVYSVNRDTGHTMLNVTYRSRAALNGSRATGDNLRAGVVSRLGASTPTVRELETVIVGIRGRATIDLNATESRAEV